MTEEEVRKVAAVVATADGWCSTCAMDLAGQLVHEFPGHPWEKLVVEAQRGLFEDDDAWVRGGDLP